MSDVSINKFKVSLCAPLICPFCEKELYYDLGGGYFACRNFSHFNVYIDTKTNDFRGCYLFTVKKNNKEYLVHCRSDNEYLPPQTYLSIWQDHTWKVIICVPRYYDLPKDMNDINNIFNKLISLIVFS